MNYTIEEMKTEELVETLLLVKKVFDKFEAPDYSEEGSRNFYKFANYENLKDLLTKNFRILVSKDSERIVGMIGFRNYSHISMLFVDEDYQKQGIARNLVKQMKYFCRTENADLTNITVNSSPYAVEFYHKIGFEKIDSEKIVDGIKFTLMNLEVYNFKAYEEADFEYLYNAKKDCFKWYVEKIYGPWDDEFQRKFLQDFFEEYKDVAKVITLGDEKIGVFTSYVDDQNESVVSLFYIDKKYQGKGLGTEILEEQLMEDQRNGRNTILQVFKENPARLFYQKLGFKVYTETETHLKMRRNVE